MNVNLYALLAGLYVVPLILLWQSSRVRRLALPARRFFWGAAIGHCVASVIVVTVALTPVAAWAPTDVARGLLGWWPLLAIPLVMGLASIILGRKS